MALTNTIATEHLIQCRLCDQQFSDPRILPCSHTYCLRCIKQYAANHNNQFECPQRDGTIVTQNFFDTLPVNQTMNDVIDYIAASSGLIQCSNCKSTTSEYWCVKCHNNYCEACGDTVHNMRAFRNHRLIPLQGKPGDLIPCNTHDDEKLKYWCQRCNEFVCSDCLLNAHRNHPYAWLTTMAQELERKVKNDFSVVQSSLRYKLDEINNLSTTTDHSTHLKAIAQSMNFLREVIDEHEREMREIIEKIQTDEIQLTEEYTSRLNNELDSLHREKQMLDILLKSKDQTKLLRATQGFLTYITRINRILDTLRVPPKQEYDVEVRETAPVIRDLIIDCGRVRKKLELALEDTTYHNAALERLITDNQEEQTWSLRRRNLTNQDIGILARAIHNNTTLTSLDLSECQIDDQGVEQLAIVLRQNRTLTTLHLSTNQIGDYGVQQLVNALQENSKLTTLDLYQNQIGQQGIRHLANMLRQNKILTTLHLSENQIGDQGASYLAEALRQNQTLLVIHLAHALIGDQGAECLADALTCNTTLTTLNLFSNNIGNHGARNFAVALRQNHTLNTLLLGNNQIGNQGAEQLVNALQKNTTLTELRLQQNPIDEQTQQDAKRTLIQNRHVTVSW